MRLRKVISGAQTGADIAGLETAKKFEFETGGVMPFGYKTLDGPKPEYKTLYGVTVTTSSSYVPRTRKNVKDADATIRLAFDFSSRGEKCTLKAIQDYKRPHFDVDLSDPPPIEDVVKWLDENNVEVLNVAGNAEQTSTGTYAAAKKYLEALFEHVRTV
jgi:hypothetical protein